MAATLLQGADVHQVGASCSQLLVLLTAAIHTCNLHPSAPRQTSNHLALKLYAMACEGRLSDQKGYTFGNRRPCTCSNTPRSTPHGSSTLRSLITAAREDVGVTIHCVAMAWSGTGSERTGGHRAMVWLLACCALALLVDARLREMAVNDGQPEPIYLQWERMQWQQKAGRGEKQGLHGCSPPFRYKSNFTCTIAAAGAASPVHGCTAATRGAGCCPETRGASLLHEGRAWVPAGTVSTAHTHADRCGSDLPTTELQGRMKKRLAMLEPCTPTITSASCAAAQQHQSGRREKDKVTTAGAN